MDLELPAISRRISCGVVDRQSFHRIGVVKAHNYILFFWVKGTIKHHPMPVVQDEIGPPPGRRPRSLQRQRIVLADQPSVLQDVDEGNQWRFLPASLPQ